VNSGGGTKQRVVEHLQTVPSATAPDLARLMGVSDAAMRQHLEQLESDGVVRRGSGDALATTTADTRHRGRPATQWSLDRDGSRSAVDVFPTAFPDRHDELAVDLLEAISDALGDDALERVLSHRGRRQSTSYREQSGSGSLIERAERLAQIRDREGYRAEVTLDDDGSITLTEHHCPIADAARSCAAVCDSELSVFREVLGADASVERTQHAMAGDSRCSYRIVAIGRTTTS
jgi:iron-sulfur cluster biosynthesis transcriptional regulator SufR